jgi:GNAT superfamily N-acetyltransferase
MEVTVRRATAVDAPALARLRWRWRGEERNEVGLGREAFVAYLTTWIVDHLATHLPFVVEVDGRLSGMAWLALADRVPSPGVMDRRYGDIQSVYVVPELRDRGIGAQLLAGVCQHARDRELAFVLVHSAAAAVRFYQRWGFVGDERWLQWRPESS